MLSSPSEIATTVVLGFIAFAGFLICLPAAAVQDLKNADDVSTAVAIILGSCTLYLVTQYFAWRFARKIWLASSDWTLLGHRRLLWQIFIPIAYSLGVAGGVLIAYEA
jgi:hypothetical protein